MVGRRADLGHDSESGSARGTLFLARIGSTDHGAAGAVLGAVRRTSPERTSESTRYLQWLDLPSDQRPTFLTLYFSDVDSAGHDFGPDSRAVADAARRLDRYLNRLMRGLERRQLQDRVNLVSSQIME